MKNNYTIEVREVEISYKSSAKEKIREISDVEKILRPFFTKVMTYKERFVAMYMNTANKMLSVHIISDGGTSSTIVDVKHIAQMAILSNANSCIIMHNHPSGNIHSSNSDIEITRKIKEALKLFDIGLLDALIITEDSVSSYIEEV